MKRALIYLRVSTPKQADEGESLEQQEEICRRYATDNGFEILRVFREPYSGRKEDRPVLDEMFAYVEENAQIDTAIIRDIDRFTRGGSSSYELFKNRLLRSDVALIDTAGIIQPVRNTLEGTGFEYEWSRVSPSRLNESMAAEQAREEITKILTRCVSQEIRLVKAGYRTRPAPIGYQNQKIEGEDGKKKIILIPDPTEAPWMQTMFSLRAESVLTDKEICQQVNALGFRTRVQKRRNRMTRVPIGTIGGKTMTPHMLQKYAKNPIFCGVIMEKWTNHLPIRAQFPGLVTIEAFNAANRGKIEIIEADDGALSVRHGAERKKRFLENPDYPYRHVIHCPKCQKPFVGSASRGKLGKRYPAYHCSRGHNYLRIPKDQFHETITRFVKKLRFRKKFLKLLQEVAIDTWRLKQKKALEVSRKSGEAVVELQKEQEHLVDQFTQTDSEVVKRLLAKKIEGLDTQISNSKTIRNKNEITENNIKQYIARAQHFIEHPAELLLNTKNLHILRQLWSFVFAATPTYEDLVDGTPELSVVFELSEGKDVKKDQLVARLSSKWNTFVQEAKWGCKLPLRIFQ